MVCLAALVYVCVTHLHLWLHTRDGALAPVGLCLSNNGVVLIHSWIPPEWGYPWGVVLGAGL